MKILAINAGSSSLKFRLFDMPEEKVLISGNFERIGDKNSFYTLKLNGEKIKKETFFENHKKAFEILVEELISNKLVTSLNDIKAIGHRIVQGGAYFDRSVVVDQDVIDKIESLATLAPLHNPAALIGISAAQEVFPDANHVVVFDTAFHQTIKEENYIYPVPYEWYTNYKVRKYGAHGTSHKYVSMRMNEILGRTDTKLITCHIGSGASISAIKNGICINTSMGLTPNAGIMMGTRCGDIDATIVTYMMEQTKMTPKEMDTALNKQSGLLGVSGVSNDARDIDEGVRNGDERCILAHKIFIRKIVDHIAKYYFELGGVDAIVLTAGIGENSRSNRRDLLKELEILGIYIDEEQNDITGKEILLTTKDSKIPVYVIPTDEELMIAKDTYNLTK